MKNLQPRAHYINGNWQLGKGAVFYSYNPANNHMIWEGCHATATEIETAVVSATKALESWSSLTMSERFQYLLKFAKEIEANRQELSHLISLETGKPLWEALTEVNAIISKVQLSFEAYQERSADKITSNAEANVCLRYKPQGVLAVLGAFNFPGHLSNGHIVPALLAGNTVVLKPSELAPAVAQRILQCWHDSGLPPGVLNGVQGGGETGKLLLSMPIQGLCFTGSYQTGQAIHRYFAGRPEVMLALEMGGNNPLLVDEVAEREAAVYYALLSTMITAGQRCSCARRLLIPSGAWGDNFLNDFLDILQSLKIGSFQEEPEPFMGPVISGSFAKLHLEKQVALISQGGKPLLEMRSLIEGTGFLTPGVIDMTSVVNPLDEEIFAPFVQVYRYAHFEDAVKLANATRYGLVAGLFSDNQTRYKQFYQEVRAGLINWNRPTTGASSALPFGGVGLSGNHRPSGYFATDYCAYPIASLEQSLMKESKVLLPGIRLSAQNSAA